MLEKEQMILLPHHHSLSALVPHQEAEDLEKKNSKYPQEHKLLS
jgi:hypothetical protein